MLSHRAFQILELKGLSMNRICRMLLASLSMLMLPLCHIASAEDVTVDVVIQSIDPTGRTISVVHNGKATSLDFSRKVEVKIKGVLGQIESILPGDKATVVYHKDLELVTRIDAEGMGTPTSLVELSELNEEDGSRDPWVTSDGLSIFWTKGDAIWTANRKDAASLFEGETQLFRGRHATVSANGLQMILLQRRADGQGGESLWHTSRESVKDSFQRPREIRELSHFRSPKNPSLSEDGLTLVFNYILTSPDGKIDYSKTKAVHCRRQLSTDSWGKPSSFPLPSVEGFVTWGSLFEDGRTFVACIEGNKDSTEGNMVVFRRDSLQSKFSDPVVISMKGSPALLGRSPRFIPSTNELVFARKDGDRPWGLWMIKGFALPK